MNMYILCVSLSDDDGNTSEVITFEYPSPLWCIQQWSVISRSKEYLWSLFKDSESFTKINRYIVKKDESNVHD